MPLRSSTVSSPIQVLVADSHQTQAQLLVSALRRRPEFSVSICALDLDEILASLAFTATDLVLINASRPGGHPMTLVRRLQVLHPEISKVLMFESWTREMVADAFRSGVRGVFSLSESPFRLLCKCIHRVHAGEVWLSNRQTQCLIQSLAQVPSLRVVDAAGSKLLTPREEQVVALVADGLANREIARELNLTENTVKKYLFRIFEKLGISTRVELVLYAVSHSNSRPAEWVAGA